MSSCRAHSHSTGKSDTGSIGLSMHVVSSYRAGSRELRARTILGGEPSVARTW